MTSWRVSQWTNLITEIKRVTFGGFKKRIYAVLRQVKDASYTDPPHELASFGGAFVEQVKSGQTAKNIYYFFKGVGKGLYNAAKGLIQFIHTILTDPGQAWEDLKNFPGAMKALWENRGVLFKKFANASPEEQAEMIGKIIGEIEAGIIAGGFSTVTPKLLTRLTKTPGMGGKIAKVVNGVYKVPATAKGYIASRIKTVVLGAVKFAAKGAFFAAKGGYKIAGKPLRGTWSVIRRKVGKQQELVYYFHDDASRTLRRIPQKHATPHVSCNTCSITPTSKNLTFESIYTEFRGELVGKHNKYRQRLKDLEKDDLSREERVAALEALVEDLRIGKYKDAFAEHHHTGKFNEEKARKAIRQGKQYDVKKGRFYDPKVKELQEKIAPYRFQEYRDAVPDSPKKLDEFERQLNNPNLTPDQRRKIEEELTAYTRELEVKKVTADYRDEFPETTVQDVEGKVRAELAFGKKFNPETGQFYRPRGKAGEVTVKAKETEVEFEIGGTKSAASPGGPQKILYDRKDIDQGFVDEMKDLQQKRKVAIERKEAIEAESKKQGEDHKTKEEWKNANQEQIRYGEELGEKAAIGYIEKVLPGGRFLKRRRTGKNVKSGEFDLIYEHNGQIYIIEAKGATSRRTPRITREGDLAEQGSKEYRNDMIDHMWREGWKHRDPELQKTAIKLADAAHPNNDKLHYIQISQRVAKDGKALEPNIEITKFEN